MKSLWTILLLILSNTFMTIAWYGHLRFAEYKTLAKIGLWGVILISWGIAFFEYCLQVPANRLGSAAYGGPFTIWELKVMQEVISLSVFTFFALFFFKQDALRLNHILGFICLVLAVYFIFKK